jgi:hypothetical protein
MKYSFLLISNKFCDLSLLHWLLFRDVTEMWGCSVVRKTYCTGPSKLATIPLYNPLKSHVGVHVHKITASDCYNPVCNAFDAGKSITRASGRGLYPGNRDFFGPCELCPKKYVAV